MPQVRIYVTTYNYIFILSSYAHYIVNMFSFDYLCNVVRKFAYIDNNYIFISH